MKTMNDGLIIQKDTKDEIARLVDQLQAIDRRLQELTGGGRKPILLPDGSAYWLSAGQAQLHQREVALRDQAKTLSTIVDALPAHIALLDEAGGIQYVNKGWRAFEDDQRLEGDATGLGQNYLETCDRTQGDHGREAHAAATGIRSVISGVTSQFALDYACQTPATQNWFRLMVSPLNKNGPGGVVVMHVNITERKLVEDQLMWKTAFFEAHVHSSLDGILVVNSHGQKILQNQRMIDLWNIPPEIAAEAGHQRRRAWITSQAKDPGAFAEKVTYLYAHPDEISRDEIELINGKWLDRYSAPVRGVDGSHYGRIWTYRDITERKRLEARFRRLVDSNAQCVIFWNQRGHISDANEAFLRLTHHTREDLAAGRINWMAMTPPEYAYLDQLALRAIAAHGICSPYEKQLICKDGSRVAVLVGAATFADNPEEGVCFALDITPRIKAEEALRQSEKRFKALFEQAAVGVAQVSVNTGKHVQVNQRFCEIVGRRPEVLLQLASGDVSHPQEDALCQQLLAQVKSGAIREYTVEKRYLRPDASEVWAGVTVSAMWAPGDAPDYVMAVVQDITTRRHLEDSFRQAQKMEAMGTLAGGIAHDFNNILASINGYTQLARTVLGDNPEAVEYLDAVLQAGERATALVRQILAFSRQEKLERAPVQLGPILKETLKLLRATIPVTTEFVISLAPDAPAVLADTNQIQQIMMNLGTNAWHALPQGAGRIEFRLEPFVVDELYAARQPRLRPGLYARVSVSDTGCGMEPATLRRIFEPFFTTKPPGVGTGLGLSVVHGIMESHDGIVTVQSQPGVGTVFHLYFPALLREAAAAAVELGSVPGGSGERILLVDDEELLAKLGHKMLGKLGYEVVVTTLPQVALEMVRADPSRFALVITDQTMPGMTGLGLASQLLKIRPGLPILLMTGFSLIVTQETVRAAGIRQLLPKPISPHALASAIHAALAHPAPAQP